MSDSNYDAVSELLCKRYEDTNELIDYHTGALFTLRTIRKESSDELRELVDDFSNHIQFLKSLDEPVNKWDTLLILIVVGKLDTRTKEDNPWFDV